MKNSIRDYISTEGLDSFKQLAYLYTEEFKYSCVLDSCLLNSGVHGGKYEFLAAYGASKVFENYDELTTWVSSSMNWYFGVLSYDLKNRFEKLDSKNNTIIPTEEITFFIPETIVSVDKNGEVLVIKGQIKDSFWVGKPTGKKHQISKSESPITKEDYLESIAKVHELIKSGNVYELNYCVPYTHKYHQLDSISLHMELLQKSPVPMAAYFRANHFAMCGASMERYLSKKGNTLLSQPIKGTIGKGETMAEDLQMISQLENSEKDKAENVMIVDLVRNDMARISVPGSIKVKELFGIYSYLQVHQMISTVTSELRPNITFDEIIRSTFPMGSMTGAPKIAAMKHIEYLEIFKRGWYSGAVGYITPEGDFDFNVVIRSILCDESTSTINYNAGGAITIDSVAQKEWEEVQLKLKAITELLKN